MTVSSLHSNRIVEQEFLAILKVETRARIYLLVNCLPGGVEGVEVGQHAAQQRVRGLDAAGHRKEFLDDIFHSSCNCDVSPDNDSIRLLVQVLVSPILVLS